MIIANVNALGNETSPFLIYLGLVIMVVSLALLIFGIVLRAKGIKGISISKEKKGLSVKLVK